MKTRNGFVSNSSTSSFVCSVCGEKYTGWDADPSQFDCSQCENEHIMCNEHLKEDVEIAIVKCEGCDHDFDRKTANFCPECGEPAWVEEENEDGFFSSESCPICTFQIYAEDEMAAYLEKTRNVSRDEVFAKIKEMNRRRRKLYDGEYVSYVCEKFDLNDDKLMAEIREKFASYREYSKFIGIGYWRYDDED